MIAADYLNQRDNAGIRDSKAVSSSQITAMAMMAVGNNTATTKSGTIRQNGQCLTQTGSSITLEPCTGKRNQEWYSDGKRLCSRSANAQCWSVGRHGVRLQTRNDSPEQEVLR